MRTYDIIDNEIHELLKLKIRAVEEAKYLRNKQVNLMSFKQLDAERVLNTKLSIYHNHSIPQDTYAKHVSSSKKIADLRAAQLDRWNEVKRLAAEIDKLRHEQINLEGCIIINVDFKLKRVI